MPRATFALAALLALAACGAPGRAASVDAASPAIDAVDAPDAVATPDAATEVDAGPSPLCGLVPSAGGARLQVKVWLAEAGEVLPAGAVLDTQTGQVCRPVRGPDGSLRCANLNGAGDPWHCEGPLAAPDADAVPFTVELLPLGQTGVSARIFVGQDGSRLFFGSFFDTQLGSPVELQAGQLLPPPIGQVVPYASQKPNCSGAGSDFDLLRIDGCSLTDQTLFVRQDGSPPRTYRTAPEDVTAWHCECPEGCKAVSSFEHVLRLTPEPLTTWQSVSAVRAGKGRYRFDAWQIGCAQFASGGGFFYDTALADEPCSPFLAEDGQTRCLPWAEAAVVAYADAQCTQPIAARITQDGVVPGYALQGQPSNGFPTADGAVRTWQVGAGAPAKAPFYYKTPSACGKFSDPMGWSVYPLLQVVPAGTFGVLTEGLR